MTQFYSKKQKQDAIEMYYQFNTLKATISKLGYPSTTSLLKWVRQDPRWCKKKRNFKHHSFDTKIACVSAYLDNGMTLRNIGKMYNVSAPQISKWAKDYLKFGKGALMPKKRKDIPVERKNNKIRPNPTSYSEEIPDNNLREYCEQLKFENDILRAELELISKKVKASVRKNSPTSKKQN